MGQDTPAQTLATDDQQSLPMPNSSTPNISPDSTPAPSPSVTPPVTPPPSTPPPGVAALGQDAPSVPPPGSFGAKFADAANKLGIAPGVGGWAKTLVAANMEAINPARPPAQPSAPQPAPDASAAPAAQGGWRGALSKLGHVAEAVGQTAGNLASGGALAAAEGGMQGQRNIALNRAENMQRIIALQKSTYRQDDQFRRESNARGQEWTDSQEKLGYATQKNITQAQLNEKAKDPNFFKDWTGRATSETEVLDGNGDPVLDKKTKLPQMTPLFTLVSTKNPFGGSGPVMYKATAQDAADGKKYGVADISKDTPMTQDQHNAFNVQVHAQANAVDIMNKDRDTDLTNQQISQRHTELADPDMQHYIAMNVEGGALAGLNDAKNNIPKHLQQLDQMIANVKKVPTPPGQDPSQNPALVQLQQKRDAMVKDQGMVDNLIATADDKQKDTYASYLLKVQTEKDKVAKDAADNAEKLAAANVKKAEEDINKVPIAPLTPEVQQKIASLPASYQAVLKQYDSNTQASLMDIAYGNGESDFKTTFPTRLTKGAPGMNAEQAKGVLSQITGMKWSEQSYAIKQGMYKSATTGPLSKQSGSLNNFVGHAAEVLNINNKLFNASNPKIFKSTVNGLSKLGYGTDAVSLQEAIQVVNGEFDNMVKGGYAPTSNEASAQATLVNSNSTVGQINAAMQVMGHMAGVRANTIDQTYKTATGNHFPNLINEENQDAARSLGIPVQNFYVGGRIGGSGDAPQQRDTQTGTPGQAAATKLPDGVPTGSIQMTTPGGKPHWIAPDKIDAAKKLGATQVTQ